MGRKIQMSWEGPPAFRWQKMAKGKRYRITCEQLGLPQSEWTKEGSYRAANAWWQSQQAPDKLNEVFDQSIRSIPPDAVADELRKKTALQTLMKMMPYPEKIDKKFLEEHLDFPIADDEQACEFIAKLGAQAGGGIKQEFTLDHQAKLFLELERSRSKKPRTYGELEKETRRLINSAPLSPQMDVRKIDDTLVENMYKTIKRWPMSENQRKKFFQFFRRMVRNICGRTRTPLPWNLNDRIFSFDVAPKEIKTYNQIFVHQCLISLPDNLKLYALLALNCGMQGVDIGNLKKIEVDLDRGTIRRKRTKTESKKDTPTVQYKLWSETLRLLRKFWSTHETWALTTRNGQKLHHEWIGDDGKLKQKSAIRQQWKNKSENITLALINFRTIGTTTLRQAKKYGGNVEYSFPRIVDEYLGHSPAKLSDKHYAAPSQEEYDEIITWLGSVFGF